METAKKSILIIAFGKGLFVLIMSLFLLETRAQDCGSGSELCAEEIGVPVSLGGALPVNLACFNEPFTAFYTFTTNEMTSPGTAIISITGTACSDGNGAQPMSLIVVEAAMGAPCQAATFSPVSGCASGTGDFTLETGSLNPDTEYTVIIGSLVDPSLNPCSANISISGQAVDIDACCDGEVPLGDPYQLTVIGGSNTPLGAPEYDWAPPETLDGFTTDSPIAYPEETTTYQVTGMVGNCEVTDFVTVFVGPPVSIPNTITPNGDLINDFWTIGGIQRFERAQVTVYDRWGQEVFQSIGYPQPWDGTHNGNKLPTAAYYYVIELNSLDVKIPPISGSITLIH
jgi:gliding motility-associated-like protein